MRLFFLILILAASLSAEAGVMPSKTRIIYNSSDKVKSLMLANTNSYPVIVQSWIDDGSGNPDVKNIPFVSIPPVFRLDPEDVKGVRVMYNHVSLPKDRETLYWFNIYEVPPDGEHAQPNRLLMTMNTQIKIIYRPESIKTTLDKAFESMSCERFKEVGIRCRNLEGVYLSVIQAEFYFSDKSGVLTLENNMLIPPFSSRVFDLDGVAHRVSRITFSYLNDDGELLKYTKFFTPSPG